MILDLIVKKTDDGYTAEVPSLKGCESWGHDEDTAIDKTIEMTAFYLKMDKKQFKVDRARASKNKIVYKLVFHKS